MRTLEQLKSITSRIKLSISRVVKKGEKEEKEDEKEESKGEEPEEKEDDEFCEIKIADYDEDVDDPCELKEDGKAKRKTRKMIRVEKNEKRAEELDKIEADNKTRSAEHKREEAAVTAEQDQVKNLCGEDGNILSDIRDFLAIAGEDTIDMLPKIWIEFITTKFIDPLWMPRFWKSVASKEDYMHCKYTRRYFPMVGSDEWKETSKQVYEHAYPEFEDNIKHANYNKGKNIKIHTNYGMIPQVAVADIKCELDQLDILIEVVQQLKDRAMTTRLWYNLATNMYACHILLKSSTGIALTKTVFAWDKNIVAGGLFYTMYLLAHEENTATHHTLESRYVFNLDQARELAFLNPLPIDKTPWIINALRFEGSVYNMSPFYLRGDRALAHPTAFKARLNILTQCCFDGFENFADIALVGSKLTECVSNNALLYHVPVLPDTDDTNYVGIVSRDRFAKKNAADYTNPDCFRRRSELYYPLVGDMASDMDIAVSRDSFKEFIRVADELIALLNHNIQRIAPYIPFTVKQDCTASGVRFHLTHPKCSKIEIFRTPQTLMQLVAGFHVPCVRMYWDFKTLWMTRSCAAALITGVNENFNWFSSNKVPADVVLKYAQRGFTTILNLKELECLSLYIKNNERWKIGIHAIGEITGAFDIDHPFFRIDALPRGIRFGLPVERTAVGGTRNNIYKIYPAIKYRDQEFIRYAETDNTFRVVPPFPI